MADIFREAPDQPVETEWTTADDVYVKQITVEGAGVYLPQHSHRYAHSTCVAVGNVRVWKDNEFLGEFAAPKLILIEAETKHLFQTLTEHTVILCIHNAARPDVAAVFAEHNIV